MTQNPSMPESIKETATELRSILGPHITVYLSGLVDLDSLNSWIDSDTMSIPPDVRRPEVAMRLRCAYDAARMLMDAYGERTARSWFFGMNHLLDNQAPAYVLRHAQTLNELRLIEPAARWFAGHFRELLTSSPRTKPSS